MATPPLNSKYRSELTLEPFSEVYANHELGNCSLPKNTFPLHEHSPRATLQAIEDELMLDGNARQNLATFCQTWVEPEIQTLIMNSLTKNLVDKDEYPQTAEIEQRCTHILANLWNAPNQETLGTATIGSSEAAMLGAMALLRQWKERRIAEGKPYDNPNLVTGPVQICWIKFCRYWNVEHREIPMAEDRLILSAEEAVKLCDENTIGVVPTFGVTFTGQYEPIEELQNALDVYQEETGINIPIHVDAASGGFLAPFVEPDIVWDFRLPRVQSINASGHKFGLAPLGIGWIIWREKNCLPEDLIFYVNYLGGNLPTININYSRPGSQVLAQYYCFLRYGREGYKRVHLACYKTAKYLADDLRELGIFDIIHEGDNGIPAVCWTLKKDAQVKFNLFDLSKALRLRGWQIPAYTMPANRQDLVVMRALIRHGVSCDIINILSKDLKRFVAELTLYPPNHHATEKEVGDCHSSRLETCDDGECELGECTLGECTTS